MKNINLKNTLIAEIIQLFAIMASADGRVSDEEKAFIAKYFQSLYPESFANVLIREFDKSLDEGVNTDALLASIHRRLHSDDKTFLLVKLIELMATDEIDSSEKTLLNTIAAKFAIPEKNVTQLIRLLTENGMAAGPQPYKFLTVSSRAREADVYLPFDGLELLVINIGKSLIALQKDTKNEVLVNDKLLVQNFTTRIPPGCTIAINGSYSISYQDLKYYFKNLDAPASTFYLSKCNQDIEVCSRPPDADAVVCTTEKCSIHLKPLKGSLITVNGMQTSEQIRVNFGDQVFWQNFKINLRTLIFRSTVQISEETKLTQSNIRKITIGNHLESTIYLEDDLDQLWDCRIELVHKKYVLNVGECPYNVYVNDRKVSKRSTIDISDSIRIQNWIVSFNSEKRVFEKRDAGINVFEARKVTYQFGDKSYGVNDLSFSTRRGELLGIMGTSGCGKSTLLNVLNGFYKPQDGMVLADGYDIHNNLELLRSYMSYVPQDDLLFENLTVYENLYYNARLRFPGKSHNIKSIVDKVLHDIGLYEKRDLVVGSPLNKILSGGERKRVNIGLELIAESQIILLDEPTSGLSSKDSERIMKLLQNLSFQGKIVYVVIHQPSVKLFEMFNKVVLLDKGGKLAYFGSPFGSFEYFRKYSKVEKREGAKPAFVDPDFLLDTLEQPIADIDGTPLPIRKYSPEFWQEAFNKHLQELTPGIERQIKKTSLVHQKKSVRDHASIAATLMQRNFVNKLRDRSNLIITFLLPPLLGLFVGAILHYNPGTTYTFYENKHIGTFLFLAVLIAIFLGITNSVEEIIKDQRILIREKMLKISNVSYFNSKVLTLLPFAFIQNLLFVFVGYFVLEGREFYWVFTGILTVVSLCGISIGLFISSIPGLTSKAAVNIIPIILIPQIVFGGALIQYQEMNKQLVFDQNSPIPEICQVMPSRWGFEAMVTYLGYNNSYREVELMQEELEDLNYKIREADDEQVVEELVLARTGLREEIERFKEKFHDSHGNLDVSQAIKIDANLEYKNYIEGKTALYPMFMGHKHLPLTGSEVGTPIYNCIMLLFMSLVINLLTLLMLRFRS